jgi:Uma2 family endonuclease
MNVVRKPAPRPMTVPEFLAWDSGDRSGRRWQLRDGTPEAMAPASDAHGAIAGELGSLIRNHLLASGRPCRLLVAPGVTPRVRARDNFRIPDLAVSCAPPGGGPATSASVLLIEILSPSNAAKTWANVWAYTIIPSVAEILVISSTSVAAELPRRGPDGHWPDQAETVAADATLDLRSIGLAMALADAYRTADLKPG